MTMSDDEYNARTVRNVCLTVFLLFSTLIGGCNVSCYLDDIHEEKMAEKGYIEVPKNLPGTSGTVWAWEKAPVEPPMIILGGPGFPDAPKFSPKIECVPHPSEKAL